MSVNMLEQSSITTHRVCGLFNFEAGKFHRTHETHVMSLQEAVLPYPSGLDRGV